jgi:hypothetical protein
MASLADMLQPRSSPLGHDLYKNIRYWPDEKYLRRNWRPERLPRDAVKRLARAQRQAVEQGVLPASLAEYMLPTAMAEGWDLYGVKDSTYGYPASPTRDDMMERMGIRMRDSDWPKGNTDFTEFDVYRDTKGGYSIPSGVWMDNPERAREVMAAFVPLIMAEKARLYGADKMVERWNGRGTAWEDDGEQMVRADAKNHVRKVEEAKRMLENPINREFLDYYRRMMK